MNTNVVEILVKKYKGKLIKQTKKETVVYIDNIIILENLFNSQEKERHKYNKERLSSRLKDLDYEENTLIGNLIIVKMCNSTNKEKCSFLVSPPCSKLVEMLKNL